MSCERNGSCHLSCNVLVRRICKAEGSLLLGIGLLYRLLLLFRCHASHRHLEILLAYRLVRRYALVLASYRNLCRTLLLVPLLRHDLVPHRALNDDPLILTLRFTLLQLTHCTRSYSFNCMSTAR